MQNLNIFIAFIAGLVSFVSPCVLPLVPSYISFIGGQRLDDLKKDSTAKRSLFLRTIFFVLGFTVIFIVMGIVFSGTAAAFSGAIRWINIVAGTVVIIFGLNLIFDFVRFLNYEKRYHFQKIPQGIGGAMLLGMAFAAGWSPCIGPILATILSLAAGSGSVASGVGLLAFYSLGLALPFLLTSIFLDKVDAVFQRIKAKMIIIQRVSGVVLIFIGILMVFGQFQQITNWLSLASFRLREWHSANALVSQLIFGFALVAWALFLARRYIFKRDRARVASSPVRFGFVLAIGILSILQLAGVIEFPLIFASWLGFQGI